VIYRVRKKVIVYELSHNTLGAKSTKNRSLCREDTQNTIKKTQTSLMLFNRNAAAVLLMVRLSQKAV